MSLRGWLDGNQRPAVPPPVPGTEPMSTDQPPADFEDGDGGRPLTTTRLRMSPAIGQAGEVVVEVVAREGLARQVLLERALPLLRRARRMADKMAGRERHAVSQESWEKLADDITALIGHSVTDQPAADELEAVLAEGTPTRLTWDQVRKLPRDYQQALTRDQLPLEPSVPAETPAEKAARHERINEALQRMGVEVIPPCPMAPYAESSESATPTSSERVDARELPPHNLNMPHRIAQPGLPDSEMIAWEQGVEGCPPGCPRRLAALDCCSSCWGMLEEPPRRACQYTGAHKVAARLAAEDVDVAPRIGPPITLRESREPAAPVETPTARATRLDREARDTQKAYARAVQAADTAWRELGGRP